MLPFNKSSRTYTDNSNISNDVYMDESDSDSDDLPDPANFLWKVISNEDRKKFMLEEKKREEAADLAKQSRVSESNKSNRKRQLQDEYKDRQNMNKIAKDNQKYIIQQLLNIQNPGILIKTYWNDHILEEVLINEGKDKQFLNIIPISMLKQIIEGGLVFTKDPRYEDDTHDFDKWGNIAGTNYIQNFMDFWRIFANHSQQLQNKKDIVPALYDYCYSHGAQIYFNRLLTVSPDTGNDELRTKWYNHFQTFTDQYPVFSRNENSLYNHLKNVGLKHKRAPLYFFLFNLITFTSAPSTDKLFNPTHETNGLAASFL